MGETAESELRSSGGHGPEQWATGGRDAVYKPSWPPGALVVNANSRSLSPSNDDPTDRNAPSLQPRTPDELPLSLSRAVLETHSQEPLQQSGGPLRAGGSSSPSRVLFPNGEILVNRPEAGERAWAPRERTSCWSCSANPRTQHASSKSR